jgi:large subunit ribosomal protein L11
MQVKLLAEGGNMKPGPALSQKLGPLGININNVIQKVNEATAEFKGLTVPVELEIDAGTKEFQITVFSPPVSGLLKKEIGIEKGSGEQKKYQVANLSIEQVILVAKAKLPTMLCNNLKNAIKTVVGSCVSLGVLIESKPAVTVAQELNEGKYADEIKEGKTETSAEKREELDSYFKELKEAQDKMLKKEKAEKEAEEEKKKK